MTTTTIWKWRVEIKEQDQPDGGEILHVLWFESQEEADGFIQGVGWGGNTENLSIGLPQYLEYAEREL
jgi:hypothetical protein